jgi:catalase
MSRRPTLTTTGGNPVADNQNSISAGARGTGNDSQKS